jgi:hypothetical protein
MLSQKREWEDASFDSFRLCNIYGYLASAGGRGVLGEIAPTPKARKIPEIMEYSKFCVNPKIRT